MEAFNPISDDDLTIVRTAADNLSSALKKRYDQSERLDKVFAAMVGIGSMSPDVVEYCLTKALEDDQMHLDRWARVKVNHEFKIYDEKFGDLVLAVVHKVDDVIESDMPYAFAPARDKLLYTLRCQTHLLPNELVDIWEYAEKFDTYEMGTIRSKFPSLLLFDPYSQHGLPRYPKPQRPGLRSERKKSSSNDQDPISSTPSGSGYHFKSFLSSNYSGVKKAKDKTPNKTKDWYDTDADDTDADDGDDDDDDLMTTASSGKSPRHSTSKSFRSKFSMKDLEIPKYESKTGPTLTKQQTPDLTFEEAKRVFLDGTNQNWNDLDEEKRNEIKVAAAASACIRLGIQPLIKPQKVSSQINLTKARRPQIPAKARKLGRFDYDVRGTSVREILGDDFMNTKFSSDSERVTVAKEIFHLVMGDPLSSRVAQEVSNDAIRNLRIGDLLPPQDHTFVGNKNSSWRRDPTHINVTVGDNDRHTSLVKSTTAALGGRRFELTHNPKDLRSFLEVIRDVIADNGLSSEAALKLIEAVTDKELREIISDKREEDADVSEVFQTIQELVSSSGGGEAVIQELNDVVRRKLGSESVPLLLLRICRLSKKIHEGDPNPERRKINSRSMAFGKMKEFIRNHFSRYENTISDHFIQARERHRENVHLGIRDDKFDELETYRNIAVSYIEMKKEDDSRYLQASGAEVRPQQGRDRRQFDKPKQVDIYAAQAPVPPAPAEKVARPMDDERNQDYRKPRSNQNKWKPKQRFHQANVNVVEVGRPPWAGNQQQDRNQGPNVQQGPPQIAPQGQQGNYHCVLCNMTNHDQYHCFKYAGQTPGQAKCQQCGGLHPYECKRKPAGQAPFPQPANFRNNPPRSYQGDFRNNHNQGRPNHQQGHAQNQPQNWRSDEPQGRNDQRFNNQNQQVQQNPRSELANAGRQHRPVGVGPHTDRHHSY